MILKLESELDNKLEELLTLDDVLIVPKFSTISSRKDVDISSLSYRLPIISANMDTISSSAMANAMHKAGGVGCLHRFMSIEENVKEFNKSILNTWCSIGVTDYELERAHALVSAGCNTLVIDVAHGGQQSVVDQINRLADTPKFDNINLVVGSFATGDVIEEVKERCSNRGYVWAWGVGIGNGASCKTRIVTGCGYPLLSSIVSCSYGNKLIVQGGVKESGDIAKALAAGAAMVMTGYMLAGTDETPGEILFFENGENTGYNKRYRGSASKESYESQGKVSSWRAPEGESLYVPYKGPAANVLQEIEGGIRSAFTYVNARDLKEFRENVVFQRVSRSGILEGLPVNKRNSLC